jgi:hypothetical protein
VTYWASLRGTIGQGRIHADKNRQHVCATRRFLDRALRTVKKYNEKVEYMHLNPVKAGLVSRPEDWRWSSYNEYAGMSAEERKKRCGLIVDRVRIPSDPRARI